MLSEICNFQIPIKYLLQQKEYQLKTNNPKNREKFGYVKKILKTFTTIKLTAKIIATS
jgi:hypothetical protein